MRSRSVLGYMNSNNNSDKNIKKGRAKLSEMIVTSEKIELNI